MPLRIRLLLQKLHRATEKLTAPQIIAVVFVGIILVGALLLTLPICAADGKATSFLTALFTATSCTCVTGLALVDTYTHWSVFGQAVMLILIQVGGLGFMTVISLFFFAMHRKIGLKERLVIAQSFGLDRLSGIVKMVKKVLLRTAIIEGTGALILTVRFAFLMPFGRALWCGVFHAVSAFCNAGFDILGDVHAGGSLVVYASDPVVNITIVLLILTGGLGFFVWEDWLVNRRFKKLTVYSKMVIVISAALVFGGGILFALLEWNNPATLGALPVGGKVLAALFQAVTTRTAGFYTIAQGALTDASIVLTDVLMFIGGGSGSTAGGAKMVTVGVLMLSVLATARGSSRVTVFKRTIGAQQIKNAVAIVAIMFFAALVIGVFLSVSNGQPMQDCLYETISAIATVGLTTGITPELNTISHLLLIVLMFFGRVGIMTISLGFMLTDGARERYSYAETKVLIG